MHQWLADGERLGLVDFDRFCLGDPELDAATFVAEIDCEDPATTPREVLGAAFLRGYADMAGPLEPDLLTAYLAHKRLAKAEKAARKPHRRGRTRGPSPGGRSQDARGRRPGRSGVTVLRRVQLCRGRALCSTSRQPKDLSSSVAQRP
jgi:hypothetical protein